MTDKYIEYDSVLLCIDLLLLKRQAYRHLIFNILENTNGKGWDGCDQKNAVESEVKRVSRVQKKFRKIITFLRSLPLINKSAASSCHPMVVRMWILISLFNVYLTWAGEEKLPENDRSWMVDVILGQQATSQYLFFLVKCITESILTEWSIQNLASLLCGWGSQRTGKVPVIPPNMGKTEDKSIDYYDNHLFYTAQDYPNSLSIAVLIASSSKLLPILMIIWSYDIPVASTLTSLAVYANMIEAIEIIIGCGYKKSTSIVVLSVLFRLLVIRVMVIVYTGTISGMGFQYALLKDAEDLWNGFCSRIHNVF